MCEVRPHLSEAFRSSVRFLVHFVRVGAYRNHKSSPVTHVKSLRDMRIVMERLCFCGGVSVGRYRARGRHTRIQWQRVNICGNQTGVEAWVGEADVDCPVRSLNPHWACRPKKPFHKGPACGHFWKMFWTCKVDARTHSCPSFLGHRAPYMDKFPTFNELMASLRPSAAAERARTNAGKTRRCFGF